MCISIQVKAKTAAVIFLLFCSAGTTWYSNRMVKNIQSDNSRQAHVQCDIIETQEIDGVYHTNWEYMYKNQTYTYTDESSNSPENHVCCIIIDYPFKIVDCFVATVTEFYIYMIGMWLFTAIFIFCACYICRERKDIYVQQV